MKVYWSLRSIPELSDLPRAERRRLWRECWGKVLGHWQIWLVFLLGYSGILGVMFIAAWLALAVGLGWPLALILVSGVWGGVFGFLLDQVSIPLARPYLRAARESDRSPARHPRARRGMLHFSESFVGGFFGFGRTYGAVARFAGASIAELEADWLVALQETAEWRSRRGDRATVLHLYFEIPPAQVWAVAAFVADQLLVPPAARPPELWGLGLEVAVFGSPDMEQYLDLILYPAETGAAGNP